MVTNTYPDYGALDNFRHLLEEVHCRELHIITGMTMNHPSDAHPWFQIARANSWSSYQNYYVWSDSDQKYRQARIIFLNNEKSNWTWSSAANQYYSHCFYSCQPDLNFDNPVVQERKPHVMDSWQGLGVDGFREGAAPCLHEREGANHESLLETHSYLKRLRRFEDEKYPG